MFSYLPLTNTRKIHNKTFASVSFQIIDKSEFLSDAPTVKMPAICYFEKGLGQPSLELTLYPKMDDL